MENKSNLSNELFRLDQKENLIIIDKLNIPEEDFLKFINFKQYTEKKCERDCFILFDKKMDKTKDDTLYIEDKLSSLMLIIGYSIAREINIYIFSKKENPFSRISNDKLKICEFSFFTVTMDHLYKDFKNENKLAKLFTNKNTSNKVKNQNENLNSSNGKNIQIKTICNIDAICEGIRKNLVNCPPKNFTSFSNIIYNFTNTNIGTVKKKVNLTEDELAFMIFKELVNKKIFGGALFQKFILFQNVFVNLNEIEQFLENSNISMNLDLIKEMNSNEKPVKNNFFERNEYFLSEDNTKEYIELISKSFNLGIFVKNTMKKILNQLNISNLDKLPNNIVKFRNYVFSLLINNCDLRIISKNIVFLEQEKLINILGDGIIYELLTKNIINISEKKKISYNLKSIEIEKYRLNI